MGMETSEYVQNQKMWRMMMFKKHVGDKIKCKVTAVVNEQFRGGVCKQE